MARKRRRGRPRRGGVTKVPTKAGLGNCGASKEILTVDTRPRGGGGGGGGGGMAALEFAESGSQLGVGTDDRCPLLLDDGDELVVANEWVTLQVSDTGLPLSC